MEKNLPLFKKQIKEDIEIIREQWLFSNTHLNKDSYTFNYWVLSRIYSIDEELISDNVTEYNDKGIDCFVHYEESKELFIIQNKYYDDNTKVTRNEVSDFLESPLSMLSNNCYRKNAYLQDIYNKAKDDPEYKIYMHFFCIK
ncbi:MAG: hypothetical protein J1F60_03875 [Oscillospiraceae bacterium]|nr:hypothetical protein [Oscillospiraceae bacterium]